MKGSTKYLLNSSLIVGVAGLMLILLFFQLGYFDNIWIRRLETRLTDFKFQQRGSFSPDKPSVVIAGIDNKSIEEFGQWPWTRDVFVRFIERMKEYNARVVAFDVIWSEKENNPGLSAIEEALGKLALHSTRSLDKKAEALKKDLSENEKEYQQNKSEGIIDDDPDQEYLLEQKEELKNQLARLSDDVSRFYFKAPEKVSLANDLFEYFETKLGDFNNDQLLGETVRKSSNILLGYAFGEDRLEKIESNSDLIFARYLNTSEIESRIKVQNAAFLDSYIPHANSLIPTYSKIIVPDLGDPANIVINKPELVYPHHGFLNATPDEDKIYRHVALIKRYCHPKVVSEIQREYCAVYPSLALKSVSMFLRKKVSLIVDDSKSDDPDDQIKLFLGGIDENNKIRLPLSESGQELKYRVNYYGGEKQIDTISFSDIVNKPLDPALKERLEGKIVFVGVTALGLKDIKTTPFSGVFPGVEIHATIAQNILEEDFLVRNRNIEAYETIGLLVLGLLLCFVCSFLPILVSTLVLAFLTYATVLVDILYFFSKGILLSSSMFMILYILVFFLVINAKYWLTEKERRRTKRIFSSYVSSDIADKMLASGDSIDLMGESKKLTVFFSDIRGYTSFSEGRDTKELVAQLGQYFGPMTEIIMEQDGTLDKYMGDAIMAFFGAPVSYSDHANRACIAALRQIEKLHELNQKWKSDNEKPISIGIGINTGIMHVGNMGSKIRFDYTVLGDEVNLGARLESINKYYGTKIIISESTFNEINQEDFYIRFLDEVKVKGKQQSTKIYELLGFRSTMDSVHENIIKSYEMAYEYYRRKDFQSARKILNELLEKSRDEPSKLLLERMDEFEKSGLPEAFPATVMSSK